MNATNPDRADLRAVHAYDAQDLGPAFNTYSWESPAPRVDALYEQAFHAAPQGLVILSTAHDTMRIHAVNAAFEALTGYSAGDVIGCHPCFLVGDDHQQAAIDEIRRAVRDGQATSVTLRTYRKNGTMFWNAFHITPLCRDGGMAVHFMGTLQDAGDQQALRSRLAQMEKMSAIGQLASGITHDFNNILGATRAFGHLLTEAIAGASPLHGYAVRIVAACDRAADLVRQLAAFTRAKDAPREDLQVRDIIHEVAALLSRRLPRAVELSVTDATQDAAVTANPSQLVQVLLNLAVNACDAMTESGGTLTIAAAGFRARDEDGVARESRKTADANGFRYATGALRPRKRYVKISVTDTGAGIAEDIAANIFEPFFTTKDKRAGSGLGLSIVNSIVTAHRGVVVVQSQAGAGSAFHIYLPARKARAADRLPAENQTTPAHDNVRGHERVLIVDDDVDIADALSISLAQWGYRPKQVYSSTEALTLFKQDPTAWDVIVTDQSMPRMGGLELIRKIKFIRPDIKAILCSGDTGWPKGERSDGDESDAFFAKPAPARALATGMRRLLDGRAKLLEN